MKVNIIGRRKNPLHIPKMMMPTHSLKKTTKTYELDGPRARMARRVEKPPWKTDEPIYEMAIFALKSLFLDGLPLKYALLGAFVNKYVCAI